jgi:hypothetical protein
MPCSQFVLKWASVHTQEITSCNIDLGFHDACTARNNFDLGYNSFSQVLFYGMPSWLDQSVSEILSYGRLKDPQNVFLFLNPTGLV